MIKNIITIIAIIIDIALYTLFFCIWYKTLNKIDRMLEHKLDRKTYNIIVVGFHIMAIIIAIVLF